MESIEQVAHSQSGVSCTKTSKRLFQILSAGSRRDKGKTSRKRLTQRNPKSSPYSSPFGVPEFASVFLSHASLQPQRHNCSYGHYRLLADASRRGVRVQCCQQADTCTQLGRNSTSIPKHTDKTTSIKEELIQSPQELRGKSCTVKSAGWKANISSVLSRMATAKSSNRYLLSLSCL